MIKKLIRYGNGLALEFDRPLLDQLNFDEHTLLELSTEGDTLRIAAVRDEERRRQFEKALKSSNERFANRLKRLAE
jgi:antitoxin component of MazEF toxin-antitoxin module